MKRRFACDYFERKSIRMTYQSGTFLSLLLTFLLLMVPNSVNGGKPCTNALLRRLDPSYKVLQYIDDVLHEWTEYEMPDGTICIAMESPEKKMLTNKEAKELIKKSESWVDQQDLPVNASTEGTTLEADENVIADPFAYTIFESDLEYSTESNENLSDPTISNMTGMGPWNASNGPASESDFDIVTQGVINADDRKLVRDTTAFPWKTVSYYSFKHPDIPGIGRCTAFAVNKYIALTNSHCMYRNGKYITKGVNTYIAPGQKGSSQPFGRFPVCAGRASAPWVSRPECHSRSSIPESCVGYDYAVIRVSRPMSSIKTFMPFVLNFNLARKSTLNTAGYPGAAQGRRTKSQYRTSGQVYQAPGTDRVFRHTMDTSKGQSGSPIWIYRPNEAKRRHIVGIHSVDIKGAPFNAGMRFVSANFDAIKNMIKKLSC